MPTRQHTPSLPTHRLCFNSLCNDVLIMVELCVPDTPVDAPAMPPAYPAYPMGGQCFPVQFPMPPSPGPRPGSANPMGKLQVMATEIMGFSNGVWNHVLYSEGVCLRR